MASFKIFAASVLIVSTVLLYSHAAPVTEFFGPPQTIEGDSNVIYPNRDRYGVGEMERFHRTYKNGTVEFKTALSNGHVQYQRITTKLVDGEKVPVYEGYISERYTDGRYGTRYYAADENGYRTSAVIVENQPPVLPRSGPYAVSGVQGVGIESSLISETDIETKTKTLKEELVKLEADLEDEHLSKLNLNENGSSATTDAGLTNVEEENQQNEEHTTLAGIESVPTDLPRNLEEPAKTDLPLILKSEESEEPTEIPQNEEEPARTDLPLILKSEESEESTDLPRKSEEPAKTDLPLISKSEESEKPESSTLSGLEDSSSTTANEEKLVEESSTPSVEPKEKDIIPTKGTVTHLEISNEPALPEISNDTSISSNKELPESKTEMPLNDDETSTVNQSSDDSEVQVPKTENPNIVKTDSDTSNVLRYPLEDASSELTTFTTTSDEGLDSETKASTELPTSGFSSKQENEPTEVTVLIKEIEIQSEVSTELPLVDSTKVTDESAEKETQEITTESQSDNQDSLISNKEAKSLDISTDLPLSNNDNSTSILEKNLNEGVDNVSETIVKSENNSSETNEETTNAAEITTEQSEKLSEEDSSTITSLKNENINNDSETSTNQPTALNSSEEKSNEKTEDKSIENEHSTEVPEESSEEIKNTTEIIADTTTKTEASTTTEENETKTGGVEVEFYPHVFQF